MHFSNDRLTILGARVVLEESVLENASLVVAAGVISDIQAGTRVRGPGDGRVLDAGGCIVGPGFVDSHCHGDGTTHFFDEPNKVVENLLKQGTTSVLATLGYSNMERGAIGEQLRRFATALQPRARAVIAGVHLEGPYVNRKYGAQTSKGVMKDFDAPEYRTLIDEFGDLIKWWTCAPELPGAMEFISYATARGQVVAAGHSEATADEIASAIQHGLKAITHWTNATGNPRAAAYAGTRRPGIDEAALVWDELSAEIIPDSGGRHVDPLMARLLLKAKGPDRVLVITDAAYARADDPRDPALEALDVSIDADGNLAGSRLTMAGAARNFQIQTGCTLPQLFRMAALNTARLVGIDQKVGSIAVGKEANLVVLDERMRVTRTFLRGEEIAR